MHAIPSRTHWFALLLALGLIGAGASPVAGPRMGVEHHSLTVAAHVAPVAPPAAPPTAPPVDGEPAVRPHVLTRVVAIGASATYGFGVEIRVPKKPAPPRPSGDGATTGGPGADDNGARGTTDDAPADTELHRVPLGLVIDAAIMRQHEPVRTYANLGFFGNPTVIGPRLVVAASKVNPTLIVAADFLFWFGYGHADPQRRLITDEAQRLDLLEEGLKHLEIFTCPVIVGDFPDMSPAVGLMLRAEQVPKPETLKAMNTRIREWAAGRPNIIIMPLGEVIERIGRGEAITIGGQSWTAEEAKNFVLFDKLHPSLDGLFAITHLIVRQVVESELGADEADFTLDRETMLTRLRERLMKLGG